MFLYNCAVILVLVGNAVTYSYKQGIETEFRYDKIWKDLINLDDKKFIDSNYYDHLPKIRDRRYENPGQQNFKHGHFDDDFPNRISERKHNNLNEERDSTILDNSIHETVKFLPVARDSISQFKRFKRTPQFSDDDDIVYFPHEIDKIIKDRLGEVEVTNKRPPVTNNRPRPTVNTPKPRPTVQRRKSITQCAKYARQQTIALTPNIVGGENATVGEFPHIGTLAYYGDTGLYFDCGATLISENYVITAAHCIQNRNNLEPTFVRMGVIELKTDVLSDSTDFYVQNIVVHPEYRTTSKYHDLALIRLNRTVPFTSRIHPACLNTDNYDPKSVLSVIGWGTTDVLRESKSNWLLKANVSAVAINTCNTDYQNYGNRLRDGITPEQICAVDLTGRGQDTCQGDSGGPLQVLNLIDGMYHLIGITSFSVTQCGKDVSGVYIRVSSYLPWIESVVWP